MPSRGNNCRVTPGRGQAARPRGAALVRDFVLSKGKGAVGLCAGAYLLSDTPDYACLHLCPMKAIDREHDERGHGFINFKPTPEGLDFFPELKG